MSEQPGQRPNGQPLDCSIGDGPPSPQNVTFAATPNPSPQKSDASTNNNSLFLSPVAMGANAQEGEMGQYLRGSNENGRTDDNTAGLLLEDSYGDEISRWMEDHKSQMSLLAGASAIDHLQQRGNADESSLALADPTGDMQDASDTGSCSESNSKRPASRMSNSSSSHKPSAKRPHWAAPPLTLPDTRSSARRRMDDALQERYQSQMALREALLALEKAKAIVSGCQSRYNAAKARVDVTAKEECESLLLEETPWNEMFQKLKRYRDETGDCNVKQSFGVEDQAAHDLVRRLSAWVGKNRKEGKRRGRRGKVSKTPIKGAAKEGSEMANAASTEQRDLVVDSAYVSTEEALQKYEDDTKCAKCSQDIPFTDQCALLQPCECRVCLPCLLAAQAQRGKSLLTCCGSDITSHSHQILPLWDASVFRDEDPDSIHADPYKEVALDEIGFDWDPRNSRWINMYEELRRYKEEHGHTLVPNANHGLGAWTKRQQAQYTLYSNGAKSDLSHERVHMLNNLGFVWSRRANTWNENFERLAKWKETNGSIHIPDDTKDPELAALNKWVSDQRVYYKRQIADEEGTCSDDPKDGDDKATTGSDVTATKKKTKRKMPKLGHDRIAKLQSIGFEFDSRDAKWLQKLDVLLKYKEQTGNFLVPSTYPEDPTLPNWVATQRSQYRLHMKGSKSSMTDRRVKILTDAGFPFSASEVRQKVKKQNAHKDRVTFDAKPWLEKYKDMLLYIATHGSLQSLQKNNPILAGWVSKQREEYPLSEGAAAESEKEETAESPALGENAALMEAAHLFLFSQSNKDSVLKLRNKIDEPPPKEESSWDDQFGNIAAWYIAQGTYAPKGMPAKMKKFVSEQQEQHRLFTSGLDSELTSERIEKLENIHFPFDNSSKEPWEDDATANRRNRSWEDCRLDLATSYIRNGNYAAKDDAELRRWAAKQKKQYKAYVAGKHSTLTFAQIHKLIDIKFVSRRPKQKSWLENCADLMAFRIQFGTFDVGSAHAVVPSKGRSANPKPSTNSPALKNLQEWVIKMRGHYCESSKSVVTDEELTPDRKAKLDSVGFPWTGPWATNGEKSDTASCAKQSEAPTDRTAPTAPIKSNLFGMTLEMQQAA